MAILEICAGSIDSVIAAQRGGATRVELCSALEIGGTTPSAGIIAEARKIEGITLNVLIRPRGGDFLYNTHEAECMIEDIRICKAIGADGVVIGALTADGNIDTALCHCLITAAEGMSITFHRAFDVCKEPQRALEDIIALGCNRILTSGQAPTAAEGTELLKELITQADERIIIMPGCGVNSNNAAKIIEATGAAEIHASARKKADSGMLFRHKGVSMGSSTYDEYSHNETCEEEVRKIVTGISCL